MVKVQRIIIVLMAVALQGQATAKDIVKENFSFADKQLRHAFTEVEKAKALLTEQDRQKGKFTPRTINKDGSLSLVAPGDWCSGFFAGELWYMYEYTGDEFWKQKAEEFTAPIEQEKTNGRTHDMGFKVYCSFGNGYRLTHNPQYRDILLQSARTLSTRFNSNVGCTRSWNHHQEKWTFPVIIDNMMNLELLFWAAQESGDRSLYDIAVSHARTTMKNHFRDDYSSYHVVDYDPATGKIRSRVTHQGYADESAWSRGQAWGLYGFTMCYRETHEQDFLQQARNIARFIFSSPTLPKDLIPYWDYNAPNIPNEPRDVSAAAVMASALYELSTYVPEQSAEYKGYADRIVNSISQHYKARLGKDYGFLLLHSTGTKPTDTEVDVPLNYADYYYLEALLRKQKLEQDLSHKMDWWQEAKFGLFVHWGPYCLYGGVYNGNQQKRGGAEWIMNRCKIPVREYRAKATTFNPTAFDAEQLVLMAKNAGMKYVVLTSKHHDGFAMFQSNASNFNIHDYTPFKRDVVDEVAKACRKHGMKLGLYYSHAQDWCNPGGATSRKEMKEGWDNPDSAYIDRFTREHHGAWDYIQLERSFEDYFHQVSLPQIRELLNRYGDLAVLWFDTPTNMNDQLAKEVADMMKWYPQIITNDRLKRPNYPGDYKTPEGKVPNPDDVKGIYWETCMNIGSSWGYKSWERNWKSTNDIIRTLIMCAARGGNLLLNVGPDPMGQVPAEAQQCLKGVGQWLQQYGEVIYGTQRSELYPAWGEVVRKDGKSGSALYLCVYDWPADGKLVLDKRFGVKKATMMADGTPLKTTATKQQTIVSVPQRPTGDYVTVVKLELNQKLPAVKLVSNTAKYFNIVDAD